ncbi:hypothetical protein LTR86_009618 [Recurvomyces mirabilis]|nr:hypothetical protein LTR86_009618 [Recurvomyces mirabilis]
MKWPNTISLGLSFSACALAQQASAYFAQTTIPWAPKQAHSVDQSTVYNNTYYLADRTNAGIHVIDLHNNTQTDLITGFKTTVVNGSISSSNSGPDGLVVITGTNELWVGDGGGYVQIIDLFTNRIVANISTGSQARADEFAYDPTTGTVVVTNPNEKPPYVTVMNAHNRSVIGHIKFTDAPGELEQPVFNAANGRFYVSVPESDANPGGEIRRLDVQTLMGDAVYPLPECVPAGIIFGTNQKMLVSCSQTQILKYNHSTAYVLDIANAGKVVANISGLSGSDQVAYDPVAGLWYMSAYQNLAGGMASGAPAPALGVVNASSYALIQTIPTDNSTAHSVAVNSVTGDVYVPISAKGIVVYALNATTTNTSTGNATSGAYPSSSASAQMTSAATSNRAAATFGMLASLSALVAGCTLLL